MKKLNFKGIIEVVKRTNEVEEDEELKLLRSVKKFEPFIKENDRGFSIESFLGMKSGTTKPALSPLVQEGNKNTVVNHQIVVNGIV